MKRTRGLILAGAGLTLGFIVGFSVIALKQVMKRELVTMLEEMVTESCECQLKYDSIDISLLTLTARARRMRIESGGKVALVFDKLRASFSLADILQKDIWLEELRLIDGFADGVTPGTPTYDFIDFLSTPLPPERDRPGRWKLKLRRLIARSSRISQPIANTRLELIGLRLDLSKMEDERFKLVPAAERVDLVLPSRRVRLSNLSGSAILDDGRVLFQSIHLTRGDSWMSTEGVSVTDENNALSGHSSFQLIPSSIGLDSYASGMVSGTGKWSRVLHGPVFKGEASIPQSHPLTITISPLAPFALTRGSFGLSVDITEEGDVTALVNPISADGKGIAVRTRSPLTLKDLDLSGSLTFTAEQLHGDGITLNDVTGGLTLSGTLANPLASITGTVSDFMIGTAHLRNAELKLSSTPAKLTGSLISTPGEESTINAVGAISWHPTPTLDSFEVNAKLALSSSAPAPLLIFSSNAKGPLDLGKIAGNGQWRLIAPTGLDSIGGPLSVSEGLVSLTQSPANPALTLQGELPLAPGARGTIRASMRDFSPVVFSEDLRCASLTGDLSYTLSQSSPREGDGELFFAKFTIGCAPYTLTLPAPFRTRIERGSFDLKGFTLVGEDSKLVASGLASLQGDSLAQIAGTAQLTSFLGILPSVDGASGRLNGNVSVRGSLFDPEVRGSGSVEDGALWMEAAGISIDKLHAQISLSEREIAIAGIEGTINGGELRGDAHISLLAPERSHASLRTREIVLTPYENTSLTFSSDISLLPGDRAPLLKGTVTIDEAHLQQQIDLKSLMSVVTGVFSPRQRGSIASSSLPRLDLDLSVVAPRNIFVVTNLFSGEFSSDLRVTGEANSPNVTGQLSSLSGWFKFKDIRFDISSGRLLLQPGESTPLLEFIAETYILSPQGENVLVFLEGRGPLSDPRISLASEEGLSEQEILTMLTLGSSFGGQTLANSGTRAEWLEPDTLLDFRRPRTFSSFFRDLTRIDSLNVEPTYNVRSGAIEPTLVARKRISDRASLVGENWFGSSEQSSRLGLFFDLSQKLNLAGGITTLTSNEQSALTLDLTYTILARQTPFIDIQANGNRYASVGDILEALRIAPSSRIPRDEVDRLRRDLIRWYSSEGFYDASVLLESHDDGKYLRQVRFSIHEGRQASISDIQIRGTEDLPASIIALFPKARSKTPARRVIADQLRAQITRTLRGEGYVAAHVTAEFEDTTAPESKVLGIRVNPGRPISFVFVGARAFSPEDFLSTINLFERSQPFGINTAGILVSNIERLYRERGYLLINLTLESTDDLATGRRTYTVTINEGPRVSARKISFIGFPFDPKTLEDLVDQSYPGRSEEIFSPEFAVQEQLDLNREVLRGLLISRGYPEVAVSYELMVSDSQESVDIEYRAVPGDAYLIRDLQLQHTLSGDLLLPPPPPLPCAIAEVNSYIERLRGRLRDEGYFFAQVQTQAIPTSDALVIEISEGGRSFVGSITIEGNSAIKAETIQDHFVFSENAPLRQAEIDETRRRILRAGLFSRVTIEPTRGDYDEGIVPLRVSVEERPLQTLEIGTGINSEDGIHLFGEATDRGIFRDGRALSFRSDLYYDPSTSEVTQGVAGFRFSSPTLFSSPFRFIEDLRFQRSQLDIQEFDLDRVTLSSSLYREWTEGWSLTLVHTLLDEALDDVSPGAIIGPYDSGDIRLSILSGTLALDRRDNPLNPSEGYTAAFDYRIAAEAMGSEASYGGVGGRVSLVTPISRSHLPRLRFATQLRGASSWAFGDADEVPITQRYYAGGRTSVRGFRENSLGPLGFDGAVIGGDVLMVGNAELRYLFENSISLVAFLDVGTVFLHSDGINWGDLRESTGLGVRYISPIGPIGVDLGFPLDEREGEPSARMHFTIGSTF